MLGLRAEPEIRPLLRCPGPPAPGTLTAVIEIEELTKRYGRTTAVDRLSFRAEPGVVTGFLGPNGAGKSTTMRALLGLDRPDGGRAHVLGGPYTRLRHPLRRVGALLDAGALDPGRSPRAHLHWLARSNRIPKARADRALEWAGIAGAASRRAGGLSLGMRQRLGVAAALMGDPEVLVLDEPVNGLDPDGVRWMRDLLRAEAAEGRTVLLSSHLMGEVARTADRLVVIARGRLVADTSVRALVEDGAGVLVRSPRPGDLARLLAERGAGVEPGDDGALTVTGMDVREVGEAAASAGIPLHGSAPVGTSLEEAYMRLTADAGEGAR